MTPARNAVLGLIVEGHGEELAAPILIRRILLLHGFHESPKISVRRASRSLLVKPGELERAIEALTRQVGRHQPILVLLDADDDCPKDLAQSLQMRCQEAHADASVAIVLANREYEAWFLAAATSLAGKNGLKRDVASPPNPEAVKGAKEWLTARMPAYQVYSPTRHQAAFSALMDLSQARRTRSFQKFEKDVCGCFSLPPARQ